MSLDQIIILELIWFAKVLHVDADNNNAVHFVQSGRMIHYQKHKINGVEIEVPTNYFYLNNGLIKDNQRLEHNGKTILEFDAKVKRLFMANTFQR